MLFTSSSVIAAVEGSSTTVAVVGLTLRGFSTIFVASVRGSTEAASFSLAAVITVASAVTSVVIITASAVISASVATDVVNVSVVFTRVAVLRGVVVSVTKSVDTSVLASVVTVEAFVVISLSTMTSTGTAVVMLVGVFVVAFVVSTTCFSAVAWEVVGNWTLVVIFSIVLIGFTG